MRNRGREAALRSCVSQVSWSRSEWPWNWDLDHRSENEISLKLLKGDLGHSWDGDEGGQLGGGAKLPLGWRVSWCTFYLFKFIFLSWLVGELLHLWYRLWYLTRSGNVCSNFLERLTGRLATVPEVTIIPIMDYNHMKAMHFYNEE